MRAAGARLRRYRVQAIPAQPECAVRDAVLSYLRRIASLVGRNYAERLSEVAKEYGYTVPFADAQVPVCDCTAWGNGKRRVLLAEDGRVWIMYCRKRNGGISAVEKAEDWTMIARRGAHTRAVARRHRP
mgnify:CR=1 FL=1